MKSFSNFLLTLYRGADKISAGEFKDWALNEVKSLIPFESCVWGSGSWAAGQPKIHSVHLNNLDGGFVASWMQYQHEDKLARVVPLNLAHTFNVDVPAEYSGTAIHEFHCKRFAMEHILGTATIDADTQLLNTMSLYRSDPNQPFTEAERALKEVIFSHLVEAVRKNWLTNLPHLFPGNQRSSFNTIATCDLMGILQVATPSFIEIFRLEWPKWIGPSLPECVSLNIQNGELKFVGAKITVCLSKIDDIFLIRTRPKIAADELSTRELEVAQRFATGSDYKTIAQQLSVSPSTIRGHLTRIYAKLGINEKASLVAEIRRMTH
jgi:DNA-binding CsgD family transcriptional regulator